jgi:hypothetical protein
MAASADRVWDLVSDVTRVGEFSPETFEAEWLGGASGPATVAGFARGRTNRNGMRVTLEKIKAVIESAGPAR